MTVKYNYKCLMCSHNYVEVRAAEETPFFTTCNSCGNGEYEEISSEILAAKVERTLGESVIEEPTND